MTDMRIRVDTPAEVACAAHSPAVAALAILFGIGVYLLAQRVTGTPASIARGLGILFALIGVVAFLRRDSFRLDLVRRRWQRVRAFWPVLRSTEGSFDTLKSVELVEDRGYRRGRPSVESEVWLRSSDHTASVRLLERIDEAAARRLQQHLAVRLGIGAPSPPRSGPDRAHGTGAEGAAPPNEKQA